MTVSRSLTALLLAIALAAPAAASGFFRFQHGGRATAQVGAMTARADDATAVFYNPAGIARLEGIHIAGGLDFNNATDEYTSGSDGSLAADHVINFPPFVYVTWNNQERFGRWAFGAGLDTTYWHREDWDPVFFEPRFLNRLTELQLWELHPVAAYAIDDRWSVGGGLRYVFGSFEQGVNSALEIAGDDPAVLEPAEVLVDANASVDGLAFDLAVHFETPVWGWGAVYRSPLEVEGDDRLERSVRDQPFTAAAQANLADLLANAGSEPFDHSVELPQELRGGVWFAPYPELVVEINLAYQAWSDFDQRFSGSPADDLPATFLDRRDWDDTLSIRIGAEGSLNESFTLFGGLALEPSPVPEDRLDPGFPRGDALIYAIGASFRTSKVTFDVGYSFHDHDSIDGVLQEPRNPQVRGSYTADDQVWSASARWAF
ncbi:MAG: outer membrane protein transport protein [Acidobacteriota bacterium]